MAKIAVPDFLFWLVCGLSYALAGKGRKSENIFVNSAFFFFTHLKVFGASTLATYLVIAVLLLVFDVTSFEACVGVSPLGLAVWCFAGADVTINRTALQLGLGGKGQLSRGIAFLGNGAFLSFCKFKNKTKTKYQLKKHLPFQVPS